MFYELVRKLLSRLTLGRGRRERDALNTVKAEFAARRFLQALEAAEALLKLNPKSSAGHALAGACTMELARSTHAQALRARETVPDVKDLYGKAVAHFASSARLSAEPCKVLSQQAVALRESGDLRASRELLERSAGSCERSLEFQLERALDCICHGEPLRARSLYEELLASAPHDPRVHAAYALALLGEGQFARGWEEYEWRLKLPEFSSSRPQPIPLWSGEDLAGRTLFVEAEQGLGDQIMFASCLRELQARGAQLIVEVSPRLANLFTNSFPGMIVVPKAPDHDWGKLPSADWRSPIGSLPRYLRRSRDDFPTHTGYLAAPSDLKNEYAARLERLGPRPRIGVAWRGGLPGTMSALRSVRLEELTALQAVSRAQVVSLEFADCRADLAAAAERGVSIEWWPEATLDMARFSALIDSLDCVVSVATTAVHMAGALGKPVCALVAPGGTWRYMWEGTEMPWYPTVSVFRPAPSGDWRAALAGVAAALETRFSRSAGQ